MSRSDDYITEVREANRMVWNGLNVLQSKQAEWNAGDYGNTLTTGTGTNAGITAAMVGASVFDSANALRTTMNTGVATNMVRLL